MIKLIKSAFYQEADTKEKLAEFILKAEQLSFGPECIAFENKFAQYQNRKYAVFCNSGSSANLALIQALLNLNKLKKGDLVAFSALTWSTNIMPLLQLGLRVMPVDIETETLNVSSRTFKEALANNEKPKMLFLTDALGFCSDIDAIADICRKKNILLMEDNCESFASVYKSKKLGNFGHASTFSFYVGHTMSTVEGGMVCTDDEELADMLRVVRAHGWDRNLDKWAQERIRTKFDVNSEFNAKYTFYFNGYNLRPTEINGFLGSNQLGYIDEIIEKRRNNFEYVAEKLYQPQGPYLKVRFEHMDFIANFAMPFICESAEQRDEVLKKCAGIVEVRPILAGDLTTHPFIERSKLSFKKNLCPNAKLVHERGFYVGNNPDMTLQDLKKIVATLGNA